MSDSPATPPLEVVHNQARRCFEASVDGHRCEITYELSGGGPTVMHLTHTQVPPALGGRGYAAQLVATALAHARAQGWRVDPQCSYVSSYMQRKPETQDLLMR